MQIHEYLLQLLPAESDILLHAEVLQNESPVQLGQQWQIYRVHACILSEFFPEEPESFRLFGLIYLQLQLD
ncbi:hypothetical protein D3C72_2322210 [compost metagenome]